MDAAGTPQPCTPEVTASLLECVAGMASSGLRTLALAMRRLPEEPAGTVAPEEGMCLIGLVGIQVRGEQAAAACATRYETYKIRGGTGTEPRT